MARHITNEADARLAHYLPLLDEPPQLPAAELPPRSRLPEGAIDTPLVRLYNFLRTPVNFKKKNLYGELMVS